MKDKDKSEDIAGILANLRITPQNNLDIEQEEPLIESLEILPKPNDLSANDSDAFPNGKYIPKGPIYRNRGLQSNVNGLCQSTRHKPYGSSIHGSAGNGEPMSGIAQFIDNEIDVEYILSRIEQPLNIPNEPSGLQDEASNGATAGIPELPKIDKKCGYKPMILIPNLDGEYQILNGNLKITLDPTLKQIGIWIPETQLDEGLVMDSSTSSVKIVIQLRQEGPKSLVQYVAKIQKDIKGKYLLMKQFVSLITMIHVSPNSCYSGISSLIDDIDQEELRKSFQSINNKNPTDLLKFYGPSKETLLMWLIKESCRERDAQSLRKIRAQIFAFLSRVLEESNEEAISMIIRKSDFGSALDYAIMANDAKIAAFLAMMFDIFGQDVQGADSQGHTLLHMIARKGDVVAPTLETLLSLHYRDHNEKKRVYSTDVKNAYLQMPIHIAARNRKCSPHVIQLLAKDSPTSLQAPDEDGSLPIHLACQFSSDPTTLATLLYHDKSVINVQRGDGFTPLHLVASRSEAHDGSNGPLIRLDEDTQVRMIKILLDHGADKTSVAEDPYDNMIFRPVDLLKPDRIQAKEYLQLSREQKRSCGSSGSSSHSGSPTPPSDLANYLDVNSCSPENSAMYNDPFWNSDNGYSSASPNMNIGSVCSNSGSEAETESDSDNCSPQKMASALMGNEDFDYIAKVLFNHPTIQAVMGAQDI